LEEAQQKTNHGRRTTEAARPWNLDNPHEDKGIQQAYLGAGEGVKVSKVDPYTNC
jgi:hypothetical protein